MSTADCFRTAIVDILQRTLSIPMSHLRGRSIKSTFFFFFALAVSAGAAQPQTSSPPVAPREPVVDDYFGTPSVKIVDAGQSRRLYAGNTSPAKTLWHAASRFVGTRVG